MNSGRSFQSFHKKIQMGHLATPFFDFASNSGGFASSAYPGASQRSAKALPIMMLRASGPLRAHEFC